MPRTPTWVGALLVAAAVVPLLLSATAPPGPGPAAHAADAAGEAARVPLSLWTLSPEARRGRAVYEESCLGCHGPEGRGDGPAAEWLDPRPRDFQSGKFKFRSTPSGELPLLEDVVHVVTCGLDGSAMRSFPLLPEPSRRAVAAYVLSLAEFGLVRAEVEYLMEDGGLTLEQVRAEHWDEVLAEALEPAYENVWPVTVGSPPAVTAASIARGQALYERQCVACHGGTGRGDGRSSYHLRDWKDAPIRPRDFTTGIFRAGSRPRDVFLRMRTGLNGTPMPAVYGSDAELWDLTHYILSLRDPRSTGTVHPTSCDARGGHR